MIGDSLIAIGTQNNIADAMKIFDMRSLVQMQDEHVGQDTVEVRVDERARYGDASMNGLASRGLHVFPSRPPRLGTIDVGVNVSALEVSGHTLFVGTAENGSLTYNVAKPDHSFVQHESSNPGTAASIWNSTNA